MSQTTVTAPASHLSSPRIVAITAGGPYPWVLFNAIHAHFGHLSVLEEARESKMAFLKRRAKRIGWLSTAGQFATMTLSRFGKRLATAREAEILSQQAISSEPAAGIIRHRVTSANGSDTLARLQELSPQVVLLCGCRMLDRKTLAAIACPVINYHAGITPAYRGMMGGYWALATGDAANFGTTMHLVDAGVDTGAILYQARMIPAARDTMLTYAMVMAAGSREIAVRAVDDALSGRLEACPGEGPSRQWYHPPIWTYLRIGLSRDVW